jgi:hypothetical protein
MNIGPPIVAVLRRSVPLLCGPLLVLALIETAAFGSCGDYLERTGGSRGADGAYAMHASGSAGDSRDHSERGDLPVRQPSKCSSGRCEGIPPLSSPIPPLRADNRELIHFLGDATGGRIDHRFSGRWTRPSDDHLPSIHKGSIDPPPPRG